MSSAAVIAAPALTTAELARRRCSPGTMESILAEELERGNVERVVGGWRAAPEFVVEFGRAFMEVRPA